MRQRIPHVEIDMEMRENMEPHDTGNLINGVPEYEDEGLRELSIEEVYNEVYE